MLLFELDNCNHWTDFVALQEQAKAGTVTEEDFVARIVRLEFAAMHRMHELLKPHSFDVAVHPTDRVHAMLENVKARDGDDFDAYFRAISGPSGKGYIARYQGYYQRYRSQGRHGFP